MTRVKKIASLFDICHPHLATTRRKLCRNYSSASLVVNSLSIKIILLLMYYFCKHVSRYIYFFLSRSGTSDQKSYIQIVIIVTYCQKIYDLSFVKSRIITVYHFLSRSMQPLTNYNKTCTTTDKTKIRWPITRVVVTHSTEPFYCSICRKFANNLHIHKLIKKNDGTESCMYKSNSQILE